MPEGQKIANFYFDVKKLVGFLILSHAGCSALDCYKCVSIDGSYPPCEDPFHSNYTRDILETPCWAGRKQRNGVFPATACVKLAGLYADSGKSLVVRGCVLDSGSITIDTELIRMSHCGAFYYDDKYVKGCVKNCFEDGCNLAANILCPKVMMALSAIFASRFASASSV